MADESPVQAPVKDEIASARRDIDLFAGWLTALPNPDRILREQPQRGIRIYSDMQRDGHIRSVFQTRRLAVLGKDWTLQPASDDPADVGRHLVRLFRAGVTSGIPTSIAHPFLPLGHIERLDAIVSSISDEEFLEVFGLAAERNVALEVTVGFLVSPGGRFSQETPVRFLSLAKKAGCRFTFGSDAHDPAGQRRLPELVRLVEAVGIEEKEILHL